MGPQGAILTQIEKCKVYGAKQAVADKTPHCKR